MSHGTDRVAISAGGDPVLIYAKRVTPNFLATLGVSLALGRMFLPGESNAIVISHGLWKDKLAGDPGVVGKSIVFGGSPRLIYGVLPAKFFFRAGVRIDALVPVPVNLDDARTPRTRASGIPSAV